MGLFKIIGLFSGLPIRPTTGRERSRMYQRQANDLMEEQLYAMQDLAQQQQSTQVPTDARPRGTCPYCLEFMLVGASTCPHCNATGITWPSAPDRCPNCVQVIPFGTTTCPHCKKTGIKWPSAPSQTPHSHSHLVQSSSSTVTSYNPNPDTTRRMKTPSEIEYEKRLAEAEAAAAAAAGPEVQELRREISKIAHQRDKMRQSLKNYSDLVRCATCNEKLRTSQADCYNCKYKKLRQRIDVLTKKY